MEIIDFQSPRQLYFVPGDQINLYETKNPVTWIPSTPFICMSRSADPTQEIKIENYVKEPIPVVQRLGGGGTVYLDSRCLCISLKLPKVSINVKENLLKGVTLISMALQEFGIPSLEILGSGDLTFQKKKFLGSTLKISRHCMYYGASIIVKSILRECEYYLAEPKIAPNYREKRIHQEFITSIEEILQTEVSIQKLEAHLNENLKTSNHLPK